jgi:hypothetical protein
LGELLDKYDVLKTEVGRIINIGESPLEARNTKQLKSARKLVAKRHLDENYYRRLLNPTIPFYPRSVSLADSNCGHISLIGAVCADGEHTPPPGFLFSGVMVQESWLDSSYIQSQSIKDLFNQSFIQATGKGSMTQQCFEMYIARHVVPHVRKRFPL